LVNKQNPVGIYILPRFSRAHSLTGAKSHWWPS